MSTSVTKEDLENELQRGRYVRAVELAESLKLSPDLIKKYKEEALWQMAAIYRNAPGTKKLSKIYGVSKPELKKILDDTLEVKKTKNKSKRYLDPCYDQISGKYLSFEEWKEQLFKNWNKF